MKLKLGILGAGRIGRIHCDNALRNSAVSVVAICDPFLDGEWASSKAIASKLTHEDEFWRCDFDAVVIASPSCEHAGHVKKAIELKKHILCEKPLDQSLQVNQNIKDLLKNYAKNFQIGFNRRFDDDFSLIAHRVKVGEIGKPYYVRISSRDPGLPPMEYLKNSGGMFFDMSIHDFDMARFIIGSEITEVYARGAALINPLVAEVGDIDTAIVTLKFANGAFGVIDNSRQAVYGYDQRVEIFGSLGALSNQNHRATSVEKSDAHGTMIEPALHFFLERYQKSYQQELAIFLENCVNERQSSPSIDDSIEAVRVAHAANLSLQHNRPVKIEEIA